MLPDQFPIMPLFKRGVLFCAVCAVIGVGGVKYSLAQEVEVPQPSEVASQLTEVEGSVTLQEKLEEKEVDVPVLSIQDDTKVSEIPSLFFTPEALALIKDAIEGLNTSTLADVGASSEKDPGIRELALGGIVFKTDDNWTIWLNGRRITPDTIPGEIFDMTVYKEFVDLKWYDAYTNRLFPVRLRANERFNLDSRLFLTGTHSEDQQL